MSDASAPITSAPIRRGWLRAVWAGLLSLVFPGLGQIYAGWWRLGVILYVVAFVFPLPPIAFTWVLSPTPYAMAAFISAMCLLVILRLAIAIDAIRRIRRGHARLLEPWYRSTWVAAIFVLGIAAAFEFGIIPEPRAGWRSFSIPSSSNMPTLMVGDYVMADIRHSAVTPTYGDMAVFRLPRGPAVDYIKRIVGLPGDRVQMLQGVLHLNGQPVRRETLGSSKQGAGASVPAAAVTRYRETLPNGCTYNVLGSENGPGESTAEYVVPPGHFFVLGDNRDNSLDSRMNTFGYVPIGNMIGVARTIYWARDLSRLFSRIE
jgi:signal peptidase I